MVAVYVNGNRVGSLADLESLLPKLDAASGPVELREDGSGRKLAGMTHGIALLVVLIAGFGGMARLGMPNPAHWPQWVWIKALIWLILGGIIVLIRRAPQFNTLLWWLLPLLGAMAAWAAIYKPT